MQREPGEFAVLLRARVPRGRFNPFSASCIESSHCLLDMSCIFAESMPRAVALPRSRSGAPGTMKRMKVHDDRAAHLRACTDAASFGRRRALKPRAYSPQDGADGWKIDVELAAVFEDFPRTFEAARHDEAVPRRKLPALASRIGDHAHASFGHIAEFVLDIVHAPLASRAGPYSGKKLVARVRVVIPERQLWFAREQTDSRPAWNASGLTVSRNETMRDWVVFIVRLAGRSSGRPGYSITSVTPQLAGCQAARSFVPPRTPEPSRVGCRIGGALRDLGVRTLRA